MHKHKCTSTHSAYCLIPDKIILAVLYLMVVVKDSIKRLATESVVVSTVNKHFYFFLHHTQTHTNTISSATMCMYIQQPVLTAIQDWLFFLSATLSKSIHLCWGFI